MDELVARLEGVRKRYKAVEALAGIDLAVRAGRVVALLGPNGAGKTTAINLLCGLRRPDSGTVELFGGDPSDPSARRQLGVTPQDTGFPESLKVREVVDLVRAHYAEPVPTRRVLERFGLDALAVRQTGGLSGGQKRRLAVALAFAGRPRLVVLDEPTTGLDVDGRRALWDVIREQVVSGVTVLLTTHYLHEAEALADEVSVIDGGRVLAHGSVGEIKGRVDVGRVRLRAPAGSDLRELPGVVRVEEAGAVTMLLVTDADEAVRALVRKGIGFAGLEVTPVSLEEAVVTLTDERRAGAAVAP